MIRMYLSPIVVLVAMACCTAVSFGNEIASIVFESDSLAPAGTTDGWRFWDEGAPGQNLAQIGSTGRTFLTGTPGNDEALFVKLATPGVGNVNDLVGAVFSTSTPITIKATDRIYIVTETFSDISSFSDQTFKIDVRWGLAGDRAAYAGFDNTIGGSTFSVNDNYNTEPTGINQQGRVSMAGNGTGQVQDMKYIGNDVQFGASDNNPGTPAENFLDRSYIVKTIYRPDETGTVVTADMQGNGFDGTDIVTTYNRQALTGDTGQPVREYSGYPSLEIDRITVHFRRFIGAYDGPGGNPDEHANNHTDLTGLSSKADLVGDPATNPFWVVNNAADLQFAIKSLRIGIAQAADVNLDGVVDALDLAIVEANQGMFTATFFDGDLNDDGAVDDLDLAFFSAPAPGDFNGDGNVDGRDFLAWQRDPNVGSLADWQTHYGAGTLSNIAAIPEPSSIMFAVFGVVVAAAYRRGTSRNSFVA